MYDRAPAAGRVVVGVSRSAASRHAVLWAAQEAHLRRSVLLVTHVDPPSEYTPDLYDAAMARHRLLADSATVASEAQPSVAVGTRVLAAAATVAAVRGAELTVVPDPGPRGGHTAGPAADTLEDAVADLARQHPALTVTIDRRGSDWIETLIEHSARAGLLVIGSHHCDDRWSVRVGTAAGLLRRRASSPVMLIGGSASAETLERDRQKAGV